MTHTQSSINTRCTITYNPQQVFTDTSEPQAPYMADFTIVYVPDTAILDEPSFDELLVELSKAHYYSPQRITEAVFNHLLELLHPQELSVTATITTTAHAPLRITIP